MSNIELRPTYWASVSGGKDSFYMLYLILQNLDKYPLDGVLHMELEMDYPFIKDVIDIMEAECKKHNIPFFRIKPRKTWEELYNHVTAKGTKYGYPTRIARWCNGKYKLDALKQLEEMMFSQGKRVVSYVGFCADEVKRFRFGLGDRDRKVNQIYPLAEMGILEGTILQWAREQPVYNSYYHYNRRCGCMGCPMSSMSDLVYLKRFYPEKFDYFMSKAKATERERERTWSAIFRMGRPQVQHGL